MTAPKPVFPGQFIFITRRCTQRQFLLRPDRETNNAFTYLLGVAAQRFGIQPVMAQMMSNHYHGGAWDPDGRQVEFRQYLNRLIAVSQNALRGRWENLWSSEEPCTIEVITAEDLLEKLVYIATNPVKDGLVERVDHWPGPKFVQALLTGQPMKATRPAHYFSDDGPMPAAVELVLKLPDHFEGKEAFLAELKRRIAEVEKQCAHERQKSGRRIVGRRSILRQSWRDCPTSREPRRNLRPRIVARDASLRIALINHHKEWQAEYQCARQLWLAGFDVEFPYGTYWLRRFANVRVKPPPEAD